MILFNSKLRINYFVYALLVFVGYSCSSVPSKPFPTLQTVPYLDLDRYLGKWYEIARYPHSFEEGCFGSTAFYEKLDDGKISVVNQCNMNSTSGELNEAIGEATVVDKKSNAKLEVQFFWPFKGDYWVIDLDQDYQYAIVSEPNRQFLWILSRSPKMDEIKLNKLKSKIQEMGFDLKYLSITP